MIYIKQWTEDMNYCQSAVQQNNWIDCRANIVNLVESIDHIIVIEYILNYILFLIIIPTINKNTLIRTKYL